MRSRSALWFRRLALWAWGATLVVAPLHYRLVLQARPQPPIYKDYTDLLLFPSDLFMLLTLGFWGLSLALGRRRLTLGPAWLSWPLAGVTAVGILSVPFSVDPSLSGYHALRLVVLGGFYLFILNEIRSLDQVILPVALQVVVQAVVGVTQVLQQHSLGLESLGEMELDPAWSGVSVVWAEGVRSLRAYGLTAHPNVLGGCLSFALILMAGWYVARRTGGRVLVGGAFVLGLLALLLTFSRAAWLGFGGGLLLGAFLLLKTGQRPAFFKGIGLLVAGLFVLLPFLWQNISYLGARLNAGNAFDEVAIERRSIAERGTLNNAVYQTFADAPLTGVGLSALPRALQERYPSFAYNYQPAHLVLLDVAAELGTVGAFLYLLILVGPWFALWQSRRQLAWSPMLIAASSALLAVTLVGFFDYYTWLLAPGRLWQWLVWGLWGLFFQSNWRGAAHA